MIWTLMLLACGQDKNTGDDTAGEGEGEGEVSLSPTELQEAVDGDAISADLSFIAEERVPGSAHWQAVQDLCADRLAELGFNVALHSYSTGVNVIGTLPGATQPERAVLISAHYDSVPDCAGADDNGSGVAALLESARVLALSAHDLSLIVACWDQEEDGLIGSAAWVAEEAPSAPEPVAVYVYETIGYSSSEPDSQSIPAGFDLVFPETAAQLEANEYRGDFLFYASDERNPAPADALLEAADEVGLTVFGARLDDALKVSRAASPLRRSDHASFWDVDLPGLFLTDTADYRNDGYHCYVSEDTIERLDMEFIRKNTAATVGAAARMLIAP